MSFIRPKTTALHLTNQMSGPRSEIGALGFVRQNGLQKDRTSFRGIGGRPQGVDLARNPNQAPQRVSPKPWSMPPGRAPNETPVMSQSLGTFLPTNPPATSQSLGNFLPANPSFPRPEARVDDSGVALAMPAHPAPDVEIREDLAACKGRLDAVGLRLSGQDNTVKAMERSVAALREEYSKISQSTDGQSLTRLEACERAVARLDAAFQEFSTEMQRAARATENLIADQRVNSAAPVLCRLLEDAEGLDALEAVHLFPPLHLNAASDVCLYRRRFSPKNNATEEADFVVQSASGDPKVVFV